MRALTRVTPQDRAAEVSRRLRELTQGSEDTLARLRHPEQNRDLVSRLEIAYLVKLRSAYVDIPAHVCVETVIAGRPDDAVRRVFARITRIEEHDGTTLDLYTHVRDHRIRQVPLFLVGLPVEPTERPRSRRHAQA